jgi:hypothetical protein
LDFWRKQLRRQHYRFEMTMRRIAFITFLLLCAGRVSAQTWSTINADAAVILNSGTPGTTLTTATANAGTVSFTCTVSTSCGFSGVPSTFLVGANQNTISNLGPVQMNGTGGTLFAQQSLNYNTIAHPDNGANSVNTFALPNVASNKTFSAIIGFTLGVTPGSFGGYYDLTMMTDNANQYAVTQVQQHCGTTGKLGLEIEGRGPTHTPCIPLKGTQNPWVSGTAYSVGNQVSYQQVQYQCIVAITGSTAPLSDPTHWVAIGPVSSYWFSESWNQATGLVKVYAFTADGTQVPCLPGSGVTGGQGVGDCSTDGATEFTQGTTGSSFNGIRIYSNETADPSDAGTTYYGPIFLNWTNPPTAPYFWTDSSLPSGLLAKPSMAPWPSAGVTGGIPSGAWPNCSTAQCTTVTSAGASATVAQILAAVASCSGGSGCVVNLTAGTFNLTTGLCLKGYSNVALRGAGANQTFIVPATGTSSCGTASGSALSASAPMAIVANDSSNANAPGNLTTVVSGSMTIPGSSTVTLASMGSLKVGGMIIFDQLDSIADAGGLLEIGHTASASFVTPGVGGPYTTEGGGPSADMGARAASCAITGPANCYHQQQYATITSCNGTATIGTNCTGSNVVITFSPPLMASNWSTANSMSAWGPTNPTTFVGVEDMSIDATNVTGGQCGNAVGFLFQNALNSWVKGTAILNSDQSHVRFMNSSNDTADNNYFFITQNFGGGLASCAYGVESWGSGNILVENNIFHAIGSPMIKSGPASNWVFGYNYTANNYINSAAYNQNGEGDHSPSSDLSLMEGNITDWATGDDIHGTSNLNTYFRNMFFGLQPECYSSGSSYAGTTYAACDNPASPIILTAYHRFYNAIGNVLQNVDATEVYGNSGSPTNKVSIIQTGVYNQGSVADVNVFNTATFWGNADNFSTYAAPRFVCTDVMNGTIHGNLPFSQAALFNSCPSTHTLPASFYYSSKPSWWPGGKPWPLNGPDITGGNLAVCSSGSQIRSVVSNVSQCTGGAGAAAFGSLANSNPAMDCYLSLGGLPNGTGPQLTNFNEAGCYTGGTPQASTPTCAPGSGTYTSAQTVTCSTASSGAIMCYTTNGATPVTNGGSACSVGTLYATSILVSGSETVTIVAGGAGFSDSSTAVYTYIIQPAISAPAAPMLTELRFN